MTVTGERFDDRCQACVTRRRDSLRPTDDVARRAARLRPTDEHAGNPAGPDPFIANPLWSDLSAVADGHDVVVEDDPWYLSAGPTGARIVLAGLTAATTD